MWGQNSRFGRGEKRRAYHGKKWYWVFPVRGDPAPWPIFYLKLINRWVLDLEEDSQDYDLDGFYCDFTGDGHLTPEDD